MDGLYTDDERLLRQTIRDFAEAELAPLAAGWDEREEFPWASMEALKRMDLMGLTMPTEYGGSGASYAEMVIVAEEIARVCMTTSTTHLTHLSLSETTIERFGSPEQRQLFLPAMTSGEKLGAFGLTEPSSGSDASDMQTTATRKGPGAGHEADAYVLNGAKIFITNGDEADVMVVFTSHDRSAGSRGTTAFIVEKGTAGFETVPMHGKMGIRGSGTANVYFTDCLVPAANRLGEEGDGFKIAMSIIDSSRIALATQSVGLAQGAFDAAVRYVQQRETFGKPLKDHQAIAFMLADMATQIDAARLLTRRSAQLKDSGLPHSKESAMAKLHASETAHFCVDRAVQIHGGYGYFRENPVERMYRDQRITEIYEGTSEVQRIVISRAVLKENAI
jgi:alkylation response protein AidB-like acyl-CoA dehydrogenase